MTTTSYEYVSGNPDVNQVESIYRKPIDIISIHWQHTPQARNVSVVRSGVCCRVNTTKTVWGREYYM